VICYWFLKNLTFKLKKTPILMPAIFEDLSYHFKISVKMFSTSILLKFTEFGNKQFIHIDDMTFRLNSTDEGMKIFNILFIIII